MLDAANKKLDTPIRISDPERFKNACFAMQKQKQQGNKNKNKNQ